LNVKFGAVEIIKKCTEDGASSVMEKERNITRKCTKAQLDYECDTMKHGNAELPCVVYLIRWIEEQKPTTPNATRNNESHLSD
jgi:hypothetical protein